MIQITMDVRALRRLLWLLAAVAVTMAALATARSAWAGVDDPPLPTVAFVARADNPVDALAAAGVAGQLGAPVYLTFPDELGGDAAGGLAATDPDVVVLAGGPAALSQQVHDQVTALLPDAEVIRKAGGTRTSTAVALNELPGELGFERPLLAGASVAGDAGIVGELTVDGVEVSATLAELTDRIAVLEATLAGVTRDDNTLVLSGMNVQIVNGENATATSNGLGNLLVGYNAPRGASTAADRAGSHYVVIGDAHHWTSSGGIVAGHGHTASGEGASVSGGSSNTASGDYSSVSGGINNTASGLAASVSGGQVNTGSGLNASVSGGAGNTASGTSTSVAGGRNGVVSNSFDSILGNTAFADG